MDRSTGEVLQNPQETRNVQRSIEAMAEHATELEKKYIDALSALKEEFISDITNLRNEMNNLAEQHGIDSPHISARTQDERTQDEKFDEISRVEVGPNQPHKKSIRERLQKSKAAIFIGGVAAGLFLSVTAFNAIDDDKKVENIETVAEDSGERGSLVVEEENNTPDHLDSAEDEEVASSPEAEVTEGSERLTDGEVQNIINAEFPEFNGNISVGNHVDFSANPHESGVNAFRNDTIESHAEHMEWLHSDDPRAQAALSRVNAFLAQHPEYAEGFFSGESLHFVQFNEAARIDGNHFYSGGKSVPGNERLTEAGDIMITYIDEDGNIISELSRRADCGNEGFKDIVPQKPGAPKVPDIDEPFVPKKPQTPVTTTVPPTTVPSTTTTQPEGTTTTTKPEGTTTTTTKPEGTTTTTTKPEGTTTTLKDKEPTPPIKDGEDDVEEPEPGPPEPTTSIAPTTTEAAETTLPPATTTPTTQPSTTEPAPSTTTTEVPNTTPPTLPEIVIGSIGSATEGNEMLLSLPVGVYGAYRLVKRARDLEAEKKITV